MLATLADIEGGSHSLAEIRVPQASRRAGLQSPDRQTGRRDRRGRRRYLDCEWRLPDGRILVLEVDGAALHMQVDTGGPTCLESVASGSGSVRRVAPAGRCAGIMAPVRSPERRDETTIDIGVALAIIAGVLAAGGVVIGVAVAAFGLGEPAVSRLITALGVVAAMVSVRYLIRRDRA